MVARGYVRLCGVSSDWAVVWVLLVSSGCAGYRRVVCGNVGYRWIGRLCGSRGVVWVACGIVGLCGVVWGIVW